MTTQSDVKLLAERAAAFLALLFPPQKDLTPGLEYAWISFDHSNREVMHYLVPAARLRRGLPLRAMNDPQAGAARELLAASVSATGLEKAELIQKLEHVLTVLDNADVAAGTLPPRGRFVRDPQGFYVSIFGRPSAKDDAAPWGWRFEGHHLSLHWTMIGGEIVSSTPQFLGAQPAQVRIQVDGGPPIGTRVLSQEAGLARQLVTTLSAGQRREAVVHVPWDVETGVARDALRERHPPLLEQRGIRYRDLEPAQRSILQQLVLVYAQTQLPSVCEARLAKIKEAGWEEMRFLWMGEPDPEGQQYYRITLPGTFEINYNNTAFNQPDHEHCVWRDYEDDWGRRALATRSVDPIAHHVATSDHHALDRLRARLRRQLSNPADVDLRLRDMVAGDPAALQVGPHRHHGHGPHLHRHGPGPIPAPFHVHHPQAPGGIHLH